MNTWKPLSTKQKLFTTPTSTSQRKRVSEKYNTPPLTQPRTHPREKHDQYHPPRKNPLTTTTRHPHQTRPSPHTHQQKMKHSLTQTQHRSHSPTPLPSPSPTTHCNKIHPTTNNEQRNHSPGHSTHPVKHHMVSTTHSTTTRPEHSPTKQNQPRETNRTKTRTRTNPEHEKRKTGKQETTLTPTKHSFPISDGSIPRYMLTDTPTHHTMLPTSPPTSTRTHS